MTEAEIDEVLLLVKKEISRACEKFPEWPEDVIHAVNVVSEECGELQKTANEAVYEPGRFDWSEKCGFTSPLNALREEAVQTAAMAVRFLMHLRQYKFPRSNQIKS